MEGVCDGVVLRIGEPNGRCPRIGFLAGQTYGVTRKHGEHTTAIVHFFQKSIRSSALPKLSRARNANIPKKNKRFHSSIHRAISLI